MKVYTIGRSADCAIVLDDIMVSRRHALLKVYSFGKMELVDLSQNGTFLNGVKLKKNVPVPVSRKDVVKIAQTRVLDWNQVPNPQKTAGLAIGAGIGLLGLIILCFVLWGNLDNKDIVNEEQVVQEDEWRGGSVHDATRIPKLPVTKPEQEKPIDGDGGKTMTPSDIDKIFGPGNQSKSGSKKKPSKPKKGGSRAESDDSFSPIF